MSGLPDGTYDVIVVDTHIDDDGVLHVEVTISAGPEIGRIVPLRNLHLETRHGRLGAADPYALLGIPGSLQVRDGVPTFRVETI